MNQYNLTTPEERNAYQKNEYVVTIRKNGFVAGTILWFFRALLRAMAFVPLCLIRYNIGTNYYGLATIFIAVIMARIFAIVTFPVENLSDFARALGQSYAWMSGENIEVHSNLLFYLSYIIIGAFIVHFMSYQLVPPNLKWSNSSRGRSIFFGWLIKRSTSIDPGVIVRILEPLTVIVIGGTLVVAKISLNAGWFIILCGLALFSQEASAFRTQNIYLNPTRNH